MKKKYVLTLSEKQIRKLKSAKLLRKMKRVTIENMNVLITPVKNPL